MHNFQGFFAGIFSRRTLTQITAFLSQYPRAYWGIQGINFLDCVFMFAYGTISIVYLSDVIGFSDASAGYVVAALSVVSACMALLSGPIIDRIGIRKALYLSAAVLIFTRAGLGLCGLVDISPIVKMVSAFVFCMAGSLPLSMLGAIYQISNKSYTDTPEAASAGFNIWYLLMNVGAVIAGFLVDFVHIVLNISWSWILLFGAVVSLVNLCVALFVVVDGKIVACKKAKATAIEILFSRMFRRVVAVVTLLIGVRAAFLYLAVLAPKYWYRAIGPDALVGTLNVINPALIIGGLVAITFYKPLREAMAKNVYSTLTVGALIAACCFIPLAVPWYFISGNIVTAYYVMAVIALIILSVGEVLWSPRLSDYIVSCAPEGQSGLYCSFASIPWLIANTMAGGLSGVMLLRWSPATRIWQGAETPLQTVLATKELPYWQTPEAMWFVLGVVAIVGPLVMLIPNIRKWFTEPKYCFFEPRLVKYLTALSLARISSFGYGICEMIQSDVRSKVSEVSLWNEKTFE